MRGALDNVRGGLQHIANAFDPEARLRADQQRSLAQIGNILAGDQIPGVLRPGGAEPLSPEQFDAARMRQLFALGSPEAAEIGMKFLDSPASRAEKEKLAIDTGNLRARNAEISQRDRFSNEDRIAQQEAGKIRREELAYQKDIDRQLKREQSIRRDTEKLSSRVEKNGVADLLTTFQNLKSLIPAEGDIPGFGATYAAPNFLISEKGQEVRQNVSALRNNILKARAGGAVTPSEAARLLQELGEGYFKDDKALRRGINNAERTLKDILKNTFAGFDQDVIDEYANRGGITLDSFNTFSPATTTEPQKVIKLDEKFNIIE